MKQLRTLFSFLCLTLAFSVSVVLGVVATSGSTMALTLEKQQECSDLLDGVTVRTNRDGVQNPKLNDDQVACRDLPDRERNCQAESTSTGAGSSTTYTCVISTAYVTIAEMEALAKEMYTDALIDELCADSQGVGGPVYSACVNGATDAFSSCFDGYISDNSYTHPNHDLDYLAGCVERNSEFERRDVNTALKNVEAQVQEAVQRDPLPGGGGEGEGTEEDSASLCQIEFGLGWILCPLTNTIASINDKAFSFIRQFLETPPLVTRDLESSAAYEAWKIMRNIANVIFVFAMLTIIYSQLTSMGISNYGVKKMLPKLIVAAVLVNVSYFAVALAVDVSNVVGSNIYGLFEGMTNSVTTAVPPENGWEAVSAGVLSAGVTGTAILGLGAIGVMGGFAMLFPLMLGALFFIVGLMFVLTFRHALVFILAIISPIAFVSYLFPNADGFYKAWYKILKLILYIYPVVAFVMGASMVASTVIWDVADQEDSAILMMIATALPAMGIVMALLLAKTLGEVMSKFGMGNPLSGMVNTAKSKARKAGESTDEFARNKRQNAGMRLANKYRGSDTKRGRALAAGGALVGGGVGMRLKQAKTEREAELQKNQTIFEEGGGLGGEEGGLAQSAKRTRQSRIITSAAEAATKQEDVEEFAQKSDGDLLRMANGDTSMQEILKSQRDTAIGQAASGLASKYENMSVPDLGEKLVEAINSGEVAAARAITSKLASAGGSGANMLRASYANLDEKIASGGLQSEGSVRAYDEMSATVRNSAVKSKAADVYEHAIRNGMHGQGKYRMDITERAEQESSWNLSDAEIASQTPDGVKVAIQKGIISPDRIDKILASDSARTMGNSDTIAFMEQYRSGGSSSTTTSPSAAPASTSEATNTRESLQKMGAKNAEAAVNKAGGVSQLSDGDLLRVRNTHGNSSIGEAAKAEIDRRNLRSGSNGPQGNLP